MSSTKHRPLVMLALGVSGLALGACSGGAFPMGESAFPRFSEPYHRFDDCDELLDWTKDTLLPVVGPWGVNAPGGTPVLRDDIAVAAPEAGAVTDVSSDSPALGNSDTNVQEQGVDEPDLVEHDGRYVYSVAAGQLRVVDIASRRETGRVTLPGSDHSLLLAADGDQRVLVTLSRDWTSDGGKTVLHRFVVESGRLEFRGADHLEGDLVDARAVAGSLHVVLRSDPLRRLEFVYPVNDTETARKLALTENLDVVETMTAEQLLPRSYREGSLGQIETIRPALGCDQIGTPQAFSGHGMTWVATVDLTAPDTPAQGDAGILSDADTVYASATSLYVATVRSDTPTGEIAPVRPAPLVTALHRFTLGPVVSYRASGEVPGRILSSYSLSEHDGVLRVATTTDGGGFGQDRMSGIRTFETVGAELRRIGEVDGLGRGESIQGVRFAGDTAFVVTFRQIDPLYTVDLSDPSKPLVLGELKIPGFSTWLVPLDGDLLLAYGQSGTDDGALTGVQWSLFDIADLADPRLLNTADAGTWSEALSEPLAILFDRASGTIAAPGEQHRTWDPVSGQELPMDGAEGSFAWFGRIEGTDIVEVERIPTDLPVRRVVVVDGDLVIVDSSGALTVFDGLPGDASADAPTRL